MPRRTYRMETKGNEQKGWGMGGNEKEDCEFNQFHYVKSKWKPWKILRQWKKESEVTQSCLTLCDPMDCSLSGSSIHGILQVGILEWVAISFSSRSSQPRDWTQVSHIVGRHFTVWATREVQERWDYCINTILEPMSGALREQMSQRPSLMLAKAQMINHQRKCFFFCLIIIEVSMGLPRWFSGKRIYLQEI